MAIGCNKKELKPIVLAIKKQHKTIELPARGTINYEPDFSQEKNGIDRRFIYCNAYVQIITVSNILLFTKGEKENACTFSIYNKI